MQLVNGFSLSLMISLIVVLSVLVELAAACGGKGGKGMGEGMKFGKKKKFGKEKFGKKKKVKSVGASWYSNYDDTPYAVSRPRSMDVTVYRPRYVEQEYLVESPPARRQVGTPDLHSRWRHRSPDYSEHHSNQWHQDYQPPPLENSYPYELRNRYPAATHPSTERPSFRKELGRALGEGIVKVLTKERKTQ